MQNVPRKTVPDTSSKSTATLSTWTALEVLSTQTYRRLEDLTGGDTEAVAFLGEDELPWQHAETTKPNCRLYYQVVLGSIKMERAFARLMERLEGSNPEVPVKGNAALAVVIVDDKGCLVESLAVTVSSFRWGVMVALEGALADLARWSQIEREIARRIEEQFSRSPKETAESRNAKRRSEIG